MDTTTKDNLETVHYLRLGDGTTVSFTVSSIPDPVAVTFIQNIPRLNAMWDDVSLHWEGKSILCIEGRPIPLVYWPKIYHYGKEHQWQGTKARWTDWRVISPETFWEEFSVNGKQMCYTAVVAKLRDQRRISNQATVARAREEYGHRFPACFAYRKGNEVHVMSNPIAIA
ncbi:hypothetical protein EV702DRAFT_961133 [Suillus placidus]|uniref:Uncharacterized protein n=1 Tax=Suillus placidus TaxID=48579 RepID=A0A9P7A552_9AGAM|nr:hypothetical protein EV702DRAFT_961133 [Suillus placidus]